MKLKAALITFLLLIISIIITLNFYFHQSYESEMAAQINEQQLIIAKTVAASIHDSLEHFEEETVSFAGLLAIRGMEREGLEEFVRYALAELQEDVDADLMIFSAEEKLVFATKGAYAPSEEDRTLLGVSRDTGGNEVYMSDSTESARKIKIVAPVRRGGAFLGSALLHIDIDDLTEKYIAPVRSGKRGYAWIMNDEGTLVYHPTKEGMIGKNIFSDEVSCYECHESFNAEKEILKSAGIGYSSYISPAGEDKLIAFSKVDPVNWFVCVSMPYSEVTASIKNSMKLQSMIVLTIFISTVIGAFITIVINRERVEAQAKADYADKVRAYADALEELVDERTEELRGEKEKLDAVIGSIEAGICIFDESGRCIWMNEVMRDWLSDEVRGHFDLDTVCRDFSLTKDVWDAVVEDRLIQDIAELDLGRKKGYFQLAISPLRSSVDTLQLLVLMQDVTEMKTAEEKLIQSDKLAALSRLSAGVAHEIGNPLTSISSYVQIMRGMDSDDFTKGALETISKHIDRIASIVKKMSSYAKTREKETRSYHIGELIENTVELVKYDKRTKNISIGVEVPDNLPPIMVNGNQMIQIFMNLVLNAADSMPGGGRLTISVREIPGEIDIIFRDTGAGIERKHLDRIFDPFFTTKELGTGLGLSVSFSIIKSFGGDILVESEPGEGTTFTVRLPIDEAA
jgi:signal transduction histidine kinase